MSSELALSNLWAPKQLDKTLSLNKILQRAEDVAQWLCARGFNPQTKKRKKKEDTFGGDVYLDIEKGYIFIFVGFLSARQHHSDIN